MLDRLVVAWCPTLLDEGERGDEARTFVHLLGAAEAVCPWVEPIRLGVLALPARGPSRFFGGEPAVVERLGAVLGHVLAAETPAGPAGTRSGPDDDDDDDGPVDPTPAIGVADGCFAAVLAARTRSIVAPGATAGFLAPWSVAVLRRPDLAVTLQRLGVHTLGQFAALPATHVSARFGGDAAACHRVAGGLDGELPGLRDPAISRRLRVVRGELGEPGPADPTDHGHGHNDDDGFLGDAPPGLVGAGIAAGAAAGRGVPRQPGFFGGTSAADQRADRCIRGLQQRLGVDAVLVGRLRDGGGRDPAARAQLVPWGSRAAAVPDGGAPARSPRAPAGAPWPGRLPTPSPVAVLADPLAVDLAGTHGPVAVSGRGLLSAEPLRLSVGGGPWQAVTAWAGPWPVTERWWSTRPPRHSARLQLVTTSGVALLLAARAGRWWLEALYD